MNIRLKSSTVLTCFLLMITLGVCSASAQSKSDYARCGQILSSVPFNTFSEWGRSNYQPLNSDYEAGALIGVQCSTDQLNEFMASAGWVLIEDRERSTYQQEATASGANRFMIYCLPNNWFRSFFDQCKADVRIHLKDETITKMSAGLRI